MGQFSWLDCIDGSQILDDVTADVYVLVPEEFGGGHIKETYYDGYGHFGGYDVYDLVADWNRKYLSEHPEHEFPYGKKRKEFVKKIQKDYPEYTEKIELKISDKGWYEAYADLAKTREDVLKEVKEDNSVPWSIEWRAIGIEIACYDEDNASLPFPIKITHNPNAVYEKCEPSKGDPNQGWRY